MTLRVYALRHVERLLARLAFQIRAVASSASPEAIHQLRVSVRRFSQALRVFREALPKRAAKSIRAQVRDIRDEAAAIRDGDVLQELFIRLGLPASHRVFRTLGGSRADEEKQLRQVLNELTSADYSARWRAALSVAGTGRGGALTYARLHLPEQSSSYFAEGRKVMAKPRTPAELHQFRIATKRFRYTLEMFAELYGPSFRSRLGQLQKIQEILGNLNDCVVAATTLRRFDRQHPLLARLAAETVQHESTFREYWKTTFDPAGAEERWLRYLTRYGKRTPEKAL